MVFFSSHCLQEEGSETSAEHFEDPALPVSKGAFMSNSSVLHRTSPGEKCWLSSDRRMEVRLNVTNLKVFEFYGLILFNH